MDTNTSTTKGTTNIADGILGAICGLITGILLTLVILIGLPVILIYEASNKFGFVIAFFVGIPFGLLSGIIVGVLVALGTVYAAVQQIVFGLVRTPQYFYVLCCAALGRYLDWDSNMEEWIYYDLVADARKSLIFDNEKIQQALNGTWAATANDGDFAKDVKEREFYDILGVDPRAKPEDIKKAYHIKCRMHHPDKHPNDPTANEKFQRVGNAYHVLSNPDLRRQYDSHGKAAVKADPVDARALYSMIFGSVDFEPLVGELWISPILKAFTEGATHAQGEATTASMQHRREVHCALLLVSKLRLFCESRTSEFLQCKLQANELAESALGGALIGLIGRVYVDSANRERSIFSSLWISLKHSCSDFTTTFAFLTKAYGLYRSLQELSKIQAMVTGDTRVPTSEEDAEALEASLREKTQAMLESGVRLLWIMTKLDLRQTIDRVCTKALHDHSVDDATLARRREALLQLGEAYMAKGCSPDQGLQDIVRQMGVFSGTQAPASPCDCNDDNDLESQTHKSATSEGDAEGQATDYYQKGAEVDP